MLPEERKVEFEAFVRETKPRTLRDDLRDGLMPLTYALRETFKPRPLAIIAAITLAAYLVFKYAL